MKKFVAFLLTLAMMFSLCVPAFAAEVVMSNMNEKSVSTSEYVMYQKMLTRTDEELARQGYTSDEIASIRNFSFEDALYKRAQRPEQELIAMGYNARQIKMLKEYDGSPIEENAELLSLTATLTGTVSAPITSTTLIQVKFSWEWDVHPLFYGDAIDDQVTFGWRGTDHQSGLMMLSYKGYYCYGKVRYYSKTTGEYVTQVDCDRTVENAQGEIYYRFEMGTADRTWAKNGYMCVGVEPTAAGNLMHSASFAIGYGHETIRANPSISVSFSGASVSLGFAWHTVEAFYDRVLVRHDGTIM